MTYRTTLEIHRDILQVCADDSRTRTKVMYGCQLSYAQVKSHLPTLVSAGLLREDGSKYFITDKGYEYIETFKKIEKLLNS